MKVKRKMPELPEVETVRKGLERLVVGKRFKSSGLVAQDHRATRDTHL